MKTSRRQELKTNELSQQIDQWSDYVRQNMTTFTTILLGAALIVGGVFWYINRERSKLMDAWATLSHETAPTDSAAAIDQYRRVAESNLVPALTVQAWLRMGSTALTETTKTKGAAPADRDWLKIAVEAFTKVVDLHPSDLPALGEALIGLGVAAEDRGEIEAARAKYKQIVEDSRFDGSPAKEQANYRLAGLDQWSKPIVFPPPPPPTSAPASAPATSQPAIGIAPVPIAPMPTAPSPSGK